MTTERLFGTDGIRDLANQGLLTPERVLALGRALGRLARERGGGVALARDPRRSSPLLSSAIAAGVAAEGVAVRDLGVLPTPGLAALVSEVGCVLGVMVSASHNAMPDNGIKVLSPNGKLDDAAERRLEAELAVPPTPGAPTGAGVGAIDCDGGALDRYLAHLERGFPGLRLDGLSIVVDAANGAMSTAAPRLLERLGARIHPLFCSPDGLNINEGCGAVHPAKMAAAVLEHGADVGLAFDGDGDRLAAASADGVVRDGDSVLFACARHLLAKGGLAGKVVVGTVMTNFGFELAMLDLGVALERTPVGDRHVAARLRERRYALGGEPSGHLIFGDRNGYVGDGLWSALELLAVMRAEGRSLADLVSGLAPVPQELLNVKVRSKPPIETIAPLVAGIRDAERELGSEGRVLVRYSGTENLLRVMVEGRDAASVARLASGLAATARREIGAPEASVAR